MASISALLRGAGRRRGQATYKSLGTRGGSLPPYLTLRETETRQHSSSRSGRSRRQPRWTSCPSSEDGITMDCGRHDVERICLERAHVSRGDRQASATSAQTRGTRGQQGRASAVEDAKRSLGHDGYGVLGAPPRAASCGDREGWAEGGS